MESPRPQSQAHMHHHIGGDSGRRSLFDDKIASAENMKYTGAKKKEWLRTTTINYLISKAYEMKHVLPWEKSFQSHVFGEHHVAALAGCGVC